MPVVEKPTVASQVPVSSVGAPAPSCKFPKAKCGYLDSSGRQVIPPAYDWADKFAGPVARVKIAGHYGLIDEKGAQIAPAEWDYIAPFANGHALALKAGRWGALGQNGAVLVPAKFARLIPMTGVIFAASTSEKDVVATDVAVLEREERIPGPLAPLSGRWGILSAPESFILPPKYREVRPYSKLFSGVIWARATQRWQLVSYTGLPVTAALYDYLDDGVDGLVVVRTANQWNVVDAAGKSLLPSETSFVRRRPDGAIGYQVGGLEGVVAAAGPTEAVFPARFERVLEYRSGSIRAMVDGGEGWFGPDGRPVTTPPAAALPAANNEDANYLREAGGSVLVCDDGVKAVRKGSAWGYFDFRNVTFIPHRFQAAGCFERGEAYVVEQGGTAWCRIDKSGQLVPGQSCTCKPESTEKAQFKAGGRLANCRAVAGERGGAP